MEYYAAIKRSKVLEHGTAWEDVRSRLRAMSQTQLHTCPLVPLFELPRVSKSTETVSTWWLPGGSWGGRNRGDYSVGVVFCSVMRKAFWKQMEVVVAQHCECTNCY